MLPEDQQRILGYFIEEAKDHIETIEQGLLNLQNTLKDPEMVNAVFRAAHSIKGGAAMLGLNSIQQTAHHLEDYFNVLKKHQMLQVDQRLVSLFLRVFDTLQELLELLENSLCLPEDVANRMLEDVEPIFEALKQHLEFLAHQAEEECRSANITENNDDLGDLYAIALDEYEQVQAAQKINQEELELLSFASNLSPFDEPFVFEENTTPEPEATNEEVTFDLDLDLGTLEPSTNSEPEATNAEDTFGLGLELDAIEENVILSEGARAEDTFGLDLELDAFEENIVSELEAASAEDTFGLSLELGAFEENAVPESEATSAEDTFGSLDLEELEAVEEIVILSEAASAEDTFGSLDLEELEAVEEIVILSEAASAEDTFGSLDLELDAVEENIVSELAIESENPEISEPLVVNLDAFELETDLEAASAENAFDSLIELDACELEAAGEPEAISTFESEHPEMEAEFSLLNLGNLEEDTIPESEVTSAEDTFGSLDLDLGAVEKIAISESEVTSAEDTFGSLDLELDAFAENIVSELEIESENPEISAPLLVNLDAFELETNLEPEAASAEDTFGLGLELGAFEEIAIPELEATSAEDTFGSLDLEAVEENIVSELEIESENPEISAPLLVNLDAFELETDLEATSAENAFDSLIELDACQLEAAGEPEAISTFESEHPEMEAEFSLLNLGNLEEDTIPESEVTFAEDTFSSLELGAVEENVILSETASAEEAFGSLDSDLGTFEENAVPEPEAASTEDTFGSLGLELGAFEEIAIPESEATSAEDTFGSLELVEENIASELEIESENLEISEPLVVNLDAFELETDLELEAASTEDTFGSLGLELGAFEEIAIPESEATSAEDTFSSLDLGAVEEIAIPELEAASAEDTFGSLDLDLEAVEENIVSELEIESENPEISEPLVVNLDAFELETDSEATSAENAFDSLIELDACELEAAGELEVTSNFESEHPQMEAEFSLLNLGNLEEDTIPESEAASAEDTFGSLDLDLGAVEEIAIPELEAASAEDTFGSLDLELEAVEEIVILSEAASAEDTFGSLDLDLEAVEENIVSELEIESENPEISEPLLVNLDAFELETDLEATSAENVFDSLIELDACELEAAGELEVTSNFESEHPQMEAEFSLLNLGNLEEDTIPESEVTFAEDTFSSLELGAVEENVILSETASAEEAFGSLDSDLGTFEENAVPESEATSTEDTFGLGLELDAFEENITSELAIESENPEISEPLVVNLDAFELETNLELEATSAEDAFDSLIELDACELEAAGEPEAISTFESEHPQMEAEFSLLNLGNLEEDTIPESEAASAEDTFGSLDLDLGAVEEIAIPELEAASAEDTFGSLDLEELEAVEEIVILSEAASAEDTFGSLDLDLGAVEEIAISELEAASAEDTFGSLELVEENIVSELEIESENPEISEPLVVNLDAFELETDSEATSAENAFDSLIELDACQLEAAGEPEAISNFESEHPQMEAEFSLLNLGNLEEDAIPELEATSAEDTFDSWELESDAFEAAINSEPEATIAEDTFGLGLELGALDLISELETESENEEFSEPLLVNIDAFELETNSELEATSAEDTFDALDLDLELGTLDENTTSEPVVTSEEASFGFLDLESSAFEENITLEVENEDVAEFSLLSLDAFGEDTIPAKSEEEISLDFFNMEELDDLELLTRSPSADTETFASTLADSPDQSGAEQNSFTIADPWTELADSPEQSGTEQNSFTIADPWTELPLNGDVSEDIIPTPEVNSQDEDLDLDRLIEEELSLEFPTLNFDEVQGGGNLSSSTLNSEDEELSAEELEDELSLDSLMLNLSSLEEESSEKGALDEETSTEDLTSLEALEDEEFPTDVLMMNLEALKEEELFADLFDDLDTDDLEELLAQEISSTDTEECNLLLSDTDVEANTGDVFSADNREASIQDNFDNAVDDLFAITDPWEEQPATNRNLFENSLWEPEVESQSENISPDLIQEFETLDEEDHTPESLFADDAFAMDDFSELEELLEQEALSDFSSLEELLTQETPRENISAATLDTELDEFAQLESLLDLDPPVDMRSNPLTFEAVDEDFADLEQLLGATSEPDNFADLEQLLGATSEPDNFADLEQLLGATSEPDNFADLEQLLAADAPATTPPQEPQVQNTQGSAPQSASSQTRVRPAAASAPRRPAFEQTMRVAVKQLDNLSNLVGELVVYRNRLVQDRERTRQFLDNLLHQVHQLSSVGVRMQELYERSLLEASLISSRQGGSSRSALPDPAEAASSGHATGLDFDALEMDRFTGFHSLSQEIIELIVRVRESTSDIEFITDEAELVARQFQQVTTHLQEGLTRSRMMSFSHIAERLPRAVREITLKYGKQAELNIEGQETLIDKMILEQLYDPMTHLVNNSITHGIETPEERIAKGKPPGGQISIRVFHQGNQTVISVSDDGAGIDCNRVVAKALEKGLITSDEARAMPRQDVYNLLFHPGFSTKDQVDQFAGRGVGMDVVRTSLSEIKGVISTDSTLGKGTTFTIRLPLTLSICKALCCMSDKARIAFPMDGVEEMIEVTPQDVVTNEEGQSCISWKESLLPFRPLKELLKHNRPLTRGNSYGSHRDEDLIFVVILRSADKYLALQVDKVLGEQEIVIKQFEAPALKPMGVAGATVLGDGRVMPIADVLELFDLSTEQYQQAGNEAFQATIDPPDKASVAVKTEPTVLIVDDSITVRELLSMTFNKAGYRVQQARDGQEAWDKLRDGLPCDIVFCDIEMPRMDGLELLSRMQKDPNLKNLPIAMLTSRGADRHRQMAVQLGARGYFTKPYLEEALLDGAQRMLKGEVLLIASNV